METSTRATLISGLEAARILNNLTDQSANLSAIITLHCDAEGRPSPTVLWTKNNQTVVEGSGLPAWLCHWTGSCLLRLPPTQSALLPGVILSRNNRTLTIQRVKREDSGRYTCTACNRRGCDSSQAFLTTEGQFTCCK